MASTNFQIFDENKTNIMSGSNYENNSQRQNGVQTGIASSSLFNKFAYQMSLMACAIAQTMVDNGKNALDTNTPTVFNNAFKATFVQKVADLATLAQVDSGYTGARYVSPSLLNNIRNNILRSIVSLGGITSLESLSNKVFFDGGTEYCTITDANNVSGDQYRLTNIGDYVSVTFTPHVGEKGAVVVLGIKKPTLAAGATSSTFKITLESDSVVYTLDENVTTGTMASSYNFSKFGCPLIKFNKPLTIKFEVTAAGSGNTYFYTDEFYTSTRYFPIF